MIRAPGDTARRRTPTAFWILLTIWLLFLGLAAGAAVGLAQVYRSDRILAGISALDVDLGGLTVAEATDRLNEAWQARGVTLTAEEMSWTLTPDKLGLRLDADLVARRAHAQGRAPATAAAMRDTVSRLLAGLSLLPVHAAPRQIEPEWNFDRAAAAETIRTLAAQIDVSAQDAGVQVVDGQVTTRQAATGRALDIAATLTTLETHPWQEALARLDADAARHIAASVVIQTPQITDVSAVVAEVSPLLAQPITLQLFDAIRNERLTWTAAPADLGRWLAFQATAPAADGSAGQSLTWSVDEAQVSAYLAAQNQTLDNQRYVNSRAAAPALAAAFTQRQPVVKLGISHTEREHIVKSGETLSSIAFDYGMPYPWIQAANPGLGDNIFVGDAIWIPSPDLQLPLAVVENKRIMISLSNQKMQAFENGQVKWSWVVSTGISSSPTSPGVFQIQSHEELAYAANWDLYMPWFMGIYRPVPGNDFMNGFHGFPSRDRRQILWTSNLGHPVTYGCILLSTTNAKLLYDWAEVGVVVEIQR